MVNVETGNRNAGDWKRGQGGEKNRGKDGKGKKEKDRNGRKGKDRTRKGEQGREGMKGMMKKGTVTQRERERM